MYFWSALIAFGVVGLSLVSAQAWALAAVALLVAIGLVLLRLPIGQRGSAPSGKPSS